MSDIDSENRTSEHTRKARWSAISGILNAVPAAAYMCDASGLITYFNPVAETIWGRAPKLRHGSERYCGSHKLYSPEGAPIRHDECWMARALTQNKAFLGQPIMIEREDGTRVVGEAHAHPLRDDQGQIVGALNLVADITGLRATTPRLSKARDQTFTYDATLAMINIVVSTLTLMIWDNSMFC